MFILLSKFDTDVDEKKNQITIDSLAIIVQSQINHIAHDIIILVTRIIFSFIGCENITCYF